MAKKDMKVEKYGDVYELSRPQWKGNKAHISNYPGLLDEVLKHTWTYQKGDHAYLTTSIKDDDGQRYTIYLHNFVLSYLFGAENLAKMLEPDNIIEHLDNDGLNCNYTNLHILSSNLNKAKAFTIDQETNVPFTVVQTFVAGFYYSQEKKRYQVQIAFNRDVLFHKTGGEIIPVGRITLVYYKFEQLYVDWLNIMKFKRTNTFDFAVLRPNRYRIDDRPQLDLTDEEKKMPIVVRDGIPYLLLKTEGDSGLAFIVKTAYRDIDDMDAEGS